MNKRKVRVLAGVCICILGISLPTIVMAETSSRRANIKSSGNIDFQDGEVYIVSSDLTYLADEIDNLEDTYKQITVNALNDVGTYFLNDGTIVNDVAQNEVDTDEEKSALSFGKITDGIRNSQSIACLSQTQVTDKDGNLLYYETEEDQTNKDIYSLTTIDTGFPAFYQAANANNLSAGTAAWVDGTLIKGNGSDNAAYYSQGWIDGMAQTLDNLDVQYTYHTHEGNDTEVGGCYGEGIVPCPGKLVATADHYWVNFWRTPIHCTVCEYGYNYDSDVYGYKQGTVIGSCTKYSTVIETICGKDESTIESVTIKY